MIRHVVMFGIKENEGRTPRQEAKRLGDLLMTLPEKISFIRHMEVGVNAEQAPDDNAELILIVDFDSIEDCAMYAIHPEHVAVAKELGKSKVSRSCVDYEI